MLRIHLHGRPPPEEKQQIGGGHRLERVCFLLRPGPGQKFEAALGNDWEECRHVHEMGTPGGVNKAYRILTVSTLYDIIYI